MNGMLSKGVRPRIVGVDFDNTLVRHDKVLCRLARERGLGVCDAEVPKRELRDAIRGLADGEAIWQEIQAEMYGPRMDEAELFPGAAAFIAGCRAKGVRLFIVSHKTETARKAPRGVNLRHAALAFMRNRGFFGAEGLGLTEDMVFFESTRREKLARIASLGCSVFVDDLEETFLEPAFPAGVEKVLFCAAPPGTAGNGIVHFTAWEDIAAYLLGGGASHESG